MKIFNYFLLKIFPTVGSSLEAIISGRKNRKLQAFVEGLGSVVKSGLNGSILNNMVLKTGPYGTLKFFIF